MRHFSIVFFIVFSTGAFAQNSYTNSLLTDQDFIQKLTKRDRDGDGVPNKKDRCPDIAGLANLLGCPDRDSDGIADDKDSCPDFYAPEHSNGCPDTDGDGLLDKDDNCPEAAGGIALDGCPDYDGDGVVDIRDFCPTIPGIKSLSGCPDSDGDGIIDVEDNCPFVSGSSLAAGCPFEIPLVEDILLADDDTPQPKKPKKVLLPSRNAPSELPNPRLTAFAEKGVSGTQLFLVKILKYDEMNTEPMEVSVPVLEEVVSILENNASQKIQINSFTTGEDEPQINKRLAAKRAKVILDFLVKKGIDPRRMKASSFGKTISDTSNTYKSARRVELILFTEISL